MSHSLSKVITVALSLGGLSSCATYSDFVNNFASERVRWQHDDYTLSDGQSAFCPKPVTETYMVMPEEGKEGTVVVIFNDGKQAVLHGDYSAMTYSEEETKAFVADEEQMQQMFGTAVDALPLPPLKTQLYFLLGKDQLTAQSQQDARTIYSEILEREAPEIMIIGHTDTLGSRSQNEALSIRRAKVVRDSLINMGVDEDTIYTQGVGENDLAIPTPDNTREPLNRRVEINIR